ncbi:MAG: serine/threonine-protein kinase [Thermoanaerobaculia bacterium]|nr:serine/threonine-protein kinase [Thermoanaerobaculia bacterium]
MEPDSLRRLFVLFDELLDLEEAERNQRLAEIAAADPDLGRDLAQMFRIDGAGEALELERELEELGHLPGVTTELEGGSTIGDYHIVRLLGRGGIGEVYLARRAHLGFEQFVALKLLRPELVSPRAVERFHRECRIQARLTHPAIVPLVDAGLAPDGRPFLALQYVAGRPITHHADAVGLAIPERLRLVVACCRAVAAAHASLVIHRDLKPSNILIAEDGSVRLLDFGIAKLLDEDEDGDLTRQAGAPMTPERAAPEQLRGEPSTTATDVWGLGVLLYELVTGRLPFNVRGRTPREIEREIRERGPTRPSRAVATLAAIAAARSTTPRRLVRELSGDLEVVLLRCLAAEPGRRYGSAAALAEDLERLLAGRPVVARGDSLTYRLRRFVGRHRLGVAASVLGALGLAGFGVALTLQAVRVARERDRAAALEKQATAVVDLLTDLFGATAPNRGAGVGDISIDQLLLDGAAKVEALRDSPAVRQHMFATLGRIRIERSEFAAGRALLERARALATETGVDRLDETRLALELDYTQVLFRVDEMAKSHELLEELIAQLEPRVAAGTHQALLAEALAQLALTVPPADGLAIAERALALRRALDPPRPVEVAASLDALGNLAFRRGDLAAARTFWSEALPILERELGDEDLRTLSTLNNLAVVAPSPLEQLALLERLVNVQGRVLGSTSGPMANLWNNLAVARVQLGDYAAAEAAARESHRLRVLVLGPNHRESVSTERNLARILEFRGRFEEALQVFDGAIERLPATGIPPENWPLYRAQRAAVQGRMGQRPAARRVLNEALAQVRAHPPGNDDLAAMLVLSARLAAAEGDLERALLEGREALTAREGQLPAGHPKIAEAQAELGRALVLASRRPEGEGLLVPALARLEGWGQLHPDDRAALTALVKAR